MAYKPINWKNYPIEETPVTASNFNHMENGIIECENEINEIVKGDKINFSEIQLSKYNSDENTLTFGAFDGEYGIYTSYGSTSVAEFVNRADVIWDDSSSQIVQYSTIYNDDIHYMDYPIIAIETAFSKDEPDNVSIQMFRTKDFHIKAPWEENLINIKPINAQNPDLYSAFEKASRVFNHGNRSEKRLSFELPIHEFNYNPEDHTFDLERGEDFCIVKKIYGIKWDLF